MPFISNWPSQNCLRRFGSKMSLNISNISEYLNGKFSTHSPLIGSRIPPFLSFHFASRAQTKMTEYLPLLEYEVTEDGGYDYEELQDGMTNYTEKKKKNSVFKRIRGFFKKNKKDYQPMKSVRSGESATDFGIVVFDDIDMNPALDLVNHAPVKPISILDLPISCCSVPALIPLSLSEHPYQSSHHYVNLENFKNLFMDFETKMDEDHHCYVNIGFFEKMNKSNSTSSTASYSARPRLTRQNAVTNSTQDAEFRTTHSAGSKDAVKQGIQNKAYSPEKFKSTDDIKKGN
ncbi:hypothetical protein CRE_17145 [Caenorhabditis remanei]|uniref:Uncharacterized protein n=2 Tax=Caenorhabditis remanei TaxID=31234 RepID=E3MAC8_CAERE|nr:hypothetical protein CRE_17145 [Caenorhabditis remanei]